MTLTAKYLPQNKGRTCKHDPDSFLLKHLCKLSLLLRGTPAKTAPSYRIVMEYLAFSLP